MHKNITHNRTRYYCSPLYKLTCTNKGCTTAFWSRANNPWPHLKTCPNYLCVTHESCSIKHGAVRTSVIHYGCKTCIACSLLGSERSITLCSKWECRMLYPEKIKKDERKVSITSHDVFIITACYSSSSQDFTWQASNLTEKAEAWVWQLPLCFYKYCFLIFWRQCLYQHDLFDSTFSISDLHAHWGTVQ